MSRRGVASQRSPSYAGQQCPRQTGNGPRLPSPQTILADGAVGSDSARWGEPFLPPK